MKYPVIKKVNKSRTLLKGLMNYNAPDILQISFVIIVVSLIALIIMSLFIMNKCI